MYSICQLYIYYRINYIDIHFCEKRKILREKFYKQIIDIYCPFVLIYAKTQTKPKCHKGPHGHKLFSKYPNL